MIPDGHTDSLGEETYAEDGQMKLGDDWTWIVDPIDGETLRAVSLNAARQS